MTLANGAHMPAFPFSISLASDATIRKRIFQRFALGQDSIDGLTQQIAQLRIAAYEGRLNQLADAMGIDANPSLYDSAVLDQMHQDARGVALGIVHTHNDDLRSFLAQQPKGVTQAQLSASVTQWEGTRQEWKSTQIVRNEGYTAANQADADVLSKNRLQLERRLTPAQAEEALCERAVQRGWLKPQQIDFDLPLHTNCVHHWEYRQSLDTAITGKSRVWLGDWVSMSTQLSADDPDNDGDVDTGDTDNDVTNEFGSFYPSILITRHNFGHGETHVMRYRVDHSHIGTVVTRHADAHAAVTWNGRVSEHSSVHGALMHLAVSHGIQHELAPEAV